VNRYTPEKILSSRPPDLRSQAQAIGVTLREKDQLEPEQSTSAIVVHHPHAKTRLGHTGEGRYPSLPWVPACAGTTKGGGTGAASAREAMAGDTMV
jgi:hypothetical protein